VTTTVCVECLQDADCFAGEVCDEANRACVPCVDNLPISSLPTPDEGCNSGAPLCELSSGGGDPTECVVCQQTVPTDDVDPGCSAGSPDCSINGAERRCLGCLTDNDCIGDQVCHEGACVACVDTAVYSAIDKGCDTAERICHLPAPTLLTEPTNLVGDECVLCRDDKGAALQDTGCEAATPICDALRQTGEVCVECLVDADCAPLGAVCDEGTNTCVLCVDSAPLVGQDDGCTVADPICDDRGAADTETCESCLDTVPLGQDLGCNPVAPVCNEAAPGGHTCVECTNDSDCGLGETCQQASNTCAPCFDDATYPELDTGCDDDTPLCVEQGIISGGGSTVILACVVCADTDPSDAAADEGCSSLSPNCNENVPGGACVECNDAADCGAGQACDVDTGNCVACIDDRLAGTIDSGCTTGLPVCATGSAATLADDECVACEDDKAAGLRDWGCSLATPFCNEAGATPVCVTCEADADCEGQLVCNAGTCVDPGVTAATDDRYTTTEGVTLTVVVADGLADNDQWPPGSSYAITVDGDGPSADEGTLVLNADGSFTFIPAPGFAGNVIWSYKITAAVNGASATASVSILVNGPPRAADDVVTTNQATPAQIDPRTNDSDPNGGGLTITRIVSGPSHGAATLSTTITYTPDPDYSGPDTIVYEVCDETNLCDTATIAITVIDVNDPPLAGDDFVSTPEDTGVVAVVLANDRDNDSAVLDVRRIMDPPLHGTVSIEPDDSIRYVPDANYNGRDAFTYEVCDSQGQCDVAVVLVTVTPVNDPPRAGDDQTTTPAGTQVIIPVIANDSDVDGDELAIARIVQQPASGTTRIEDDGSITYTPAGNTSGVVVFSYEVCDLELCDIAEVRVTVGVDNDPPNAVDDLVTTDLDEPVVIDVLANDSDPNGDPLTLQQVGLSSSGTAIIADGEVLFTPSRGFVGDATFSYTICDNRGACSTAVVTVAVLTGGNRPPLATDDVASTSVNTAVNLDPTLNDVDLDNDPIAVEDITTQPLHGTAVLEADGSVTYTPEPGFVGTDTFIVSVTDGFGGFDESRVTVFVSDGGNKPPVAVDDDYEVSTEAAAVLDVLGNDSDPDGDAIVIVDVVQGQKGVVTVVVEGGVTTLVYTPRPGASGTDTFTYTISDGKGGTDTATVTVEFPVGNGRPDAIGESVTTPEDTAIVVVVLANDSDPDGDTIALASIEVEPRHGTVVIEGDVVRYTPAANYVGNDSFTYRMCDGNGACDTAVVGVVVTPVNDAPIANDDAYAVSAAGVTTLPVTLNDSDPEHDALTVTIVSEPTKGSVTVNADGSVAYTPTGSGSDTFTYRVCDPSGACDEATVAIEIGGANRNPVAVDDDAETTSETPVTIDVLANDSDADGDALSVSAVEDPAHGTATVEGNEVVYTPDADFSGTDMFFYTVCDASGACATAYVVVDVTADVNTPPVSPSTTPCRPRRARRCASTRRPTTSTPTATT
jgi:Cys-rich repeat protein